MAETKADLLKKAAELGLKDITPKNTMADIREAIAAAAPKKHDKEALPTEEHEAPVAKAGKRSAKALKEAEEAQAKEERKSAETDKTDAAKKPAPKPRTRLERAGKKFREAAKLIEEGKEYAIKDALELAVKTSPVKFDATVELHINLNVDPRQADQNLRGTLSLPSGTGKTVRVAVADDDLLKKLDKGVIEFDVLVSTPDFMPKLGKYARLLGPKGLMPNPKSGTVTTDVNKAVKEAQAGRVEYRVDSTGIVHLGIGKVSFGADKLMANAQTVFDGIKASKPASIKGTFVRSITVSTSMGPGIKVLAAEL